MKKLITILGLSVLLAGCGETDTSDTNAIEDETMQTNNGPSSEIGEESKSSQEIEEVESTNEISIGERNNIIEVARELNESLTYYQARYVDDSHAIVVLIDDNVILNEYLRAIEGEPAYVDAFQSTGNTLQDTSRKIVRDSGVDDLALIFAAPLEDNNAAIIFKFENGERLIDVFEELGYY